MSAETRARAYLKALGGAVEGAGGDQHTYTAVLNCFGFGLDQADALAVLADWNASCSPPWGDRELESKVRSVYAQTRLPFGFKLEESDEPAPIRTPRYPPGAHEYVVQCFGTGRPSSVVVDWARARGFTPEQLIRAGAHTIFLGAADDPAWPWKAGYGVVVPLFDANGKVRSLRARWSKVEDDPIAGWREIRSPGPKSLPPHGYDVSGLVLADARGAALLHYGRTGRFVGNGRFEPDDLPSTVWIVEGEPDLLTMSVVLAHKNDRDMVLGVFSGAWTWDHAKRIPEHATVVVATHDDLQGRKYAEEITESLYGRVAAVQRYKPRSGDR